MISKLLIANRGEVAGRIASTCRLMGISPVAVFSEADRDALFVRMADEAVFLGPSSPSESYLEIEKVVQAALTVGADAVHPGYGFLAENAEFARRVREAGLIFVGPSADVIEQMGSKVAARDLCRSAGVPTVPGSGALDDSGLIDWAENNGYPVMLKASAGGGGKGMRRLTTRPELEAALSSARREALKAFGSEAVYLEKAVLNGRHLEVQVVGDANGHVVHLGVRECSLQRRHQKLVEESPPVNVSPAVLAGLTQSAVKLATDVGYTNLGTVEFLVEGEQYYFLEMNTRLQVEHPVTEMITGLDLVQLGIDIAQGIPLAFQQSDVSFNGHAVEARVACEDPYVGFLPDTGRVLMWQTGGGARFDTTLESGADIAPYYDSMVCKVIGWGETREHALRRLDAALGSTVLLGVKHNIDFLRQLLRLPQVREGRQHTELVESLTWDKPEVPRKALLAATVTRWAHLTGGRKPVGALPLDLKFEQHPVVRVSGDLYTVEDEEYEVSISNNALEVNGHRFSVVAALETDHCWVHTPMGTFAFSAVARHPVPQAAGGGGSLLAPMPGSVVEIMVEAGSSVKQGDPLLKLEAMKMEQMITSPEDGTIEAIHFSVGDQVEAGACLVSLGKGE